MSEFVPGDCLRIFDILSIEKGRMSKEYTISRGLGARNGKQPVFKRKV